MDQLGLDLGLFISQIVNFGLLVVVLYAFLYKPILGKLEERARRIRKGLDDADQAEKLLAETQVRQSKEIEGARQEAHDIIERATSSAEQQRQEILAQARQEAHDLILRAQQQAQHELEEARVALGQQVIDLAMAAASRLLQENLDEEKNLQLVRNFITEVDQLG